MHTLQFPLPILYSSNGSRKSSKNFLDFFFPSPLYFVHTEQYAFIFYIQLDDQQLFLYSGERAQLSELFC